EEQIEQILGTPEVDCAIDAVGFEASGHGVGAGEAPAAVLNSVMGITRAGGRLGIPGLYVTGDPGAEDIDAQEGTLKIRFGLGFAKAHTFASGQTPVMRDLKDLMQFILSGKAQIAKDVNATIISLDQAHESYQAFDGGAAQKFVIDPHGMLK